MSGYDINLIRGVRELESIYRNNGEIILNMQATIQYI